MSDLQSTTRRRYGTFRGFIRLALGQCELACGRLNPWIRPDLGRVQRLVLVCLGNINRSAYGHALAERLGLPAASFGLSTSTGQPATAQAISTARILGLDLLAHRATDLSDFEILPGDLLLVMEIRHARILAPKVAGTGAQIALLGYWARPQRVHIHDPHTLDAEYFATCFGVIGNALQRLDDEYHSAHLSP